MSIIHPIDKNKHPDYTDLAFQHKTYLDIARKKIENIEADHHHKKYKPYCRVCARMDFAAEQEGTFARKPPVGCREARMIDLKHFDYNKYSGDKHFDFVKEDPWFEQIRINGVASNDQRGIWRLFRCKDRGCNISLQLPYAVVELEKNKKKGR